MYVITKNWRDIKPPPGSQLNFSHPLAQGMVGCWLLNENGGKKVINLALNKTGTLSAGVGGWKNNNVLFDGANTLINGGTLPQLSQCTIVCLCNPASIGEGTSSFRSRMFGFGTTIQAGTLFFGLVDTNALQFVKDYDGASDLTSRTANSTVVFSALKLYSVSWNGSNLATSLKFYINGINKVGTGTLIDGVGNPVFDASLPSTIGNETGLSKTFNGYINSVFVYNRVLSPAEHSALYEAPYQMIMPKKSRFVSISAGGPPPPIVSAGFRRGSFLTLGCG